MSGIKHCFAVNDSGVISDFFYSSSGGFEGHIDSVLSNKLWRSSCKYTKLIL